MVSVTIENIILRTPDSRFYDIHDVHRYFVANVHCEQVLFTYQYPYVKMPTALGNYLWRDSISLKKSSLLHERDVYSALEITLKKMLVAQSQMDRMIIPDRVFKLDRLDYFRRKSFFSLVYKIISFQDRLQLVSFENLRCKRLEGVGLIQRLACFNAETLKYLFLWRFVLPNENPILVNYSYITGSGQYIPRPDSRYAFLRSLAELRNLRLLALEYAHIADGTGAALLSLQHIMKRAHFRLQLMCRENQIPGRADPALGVGGYDIPDTAWRRVTTTCPDLYLLLAFFRTRNYDDVRRFLTPSMPLREVHLQLGIDLLMEQRQDSDLSCFIRYVAYRYMDTLVTFSIHQWRFVTFPLRRILELMPRLVRLYYVGRVKDAADLRSLFSMIACGVCERLKQVKIQIQDEEDTREYWRKAVETLTEEFTDIMELYNIKFSLTVYKH
ncbi:unnamed protein product [Chrysodeixis includens]|uniref:Uncharacterized protein n=1 Tax=Chrysodeixis includens TaxID=689277 RepID=A0A9P0FPC9_CHRIL|nr:unnamed protein product [Chrysodeixis includens]